MREGYRLAIPILVSLLLLTGLGFLYSSSDDLSTRVALLEKRVAYLEQYLRPQPDDSTAQACATALDWSQAANHVGETAAVRGPVVSTFYAATSEGQPTFLNIGAPYPDPGRFIGVIWGQDRLNFPMPPEYLYKGRTICVFGTIKSYDGVPEIFITRSGQIKIEED